MSEVDTASDWVAVILVGWFIVGLVMAAVVAMIANSKNRDALGWGFLGFLFGVFALIAVLVVPEVARVPQGMVSATCPRCNAKQNVSRAERSYDCWQCHLVSPTPADTRAYVPLTPEQQAQQEEEFRKSRPFRYARIGVGIGIAWAVTTGVVGATQGDFKAMTIISGIILLGTLGGLLGAAAGSITDRIKARP